MHQLALATRLVLAYSLYLISLSNLGMMKHPLGLHTHQVVTSSVHVMAVSATSDTPAATTGGRKWPRLWEGQTLKGDATTAADPSASW